MSPTSYQTAPPRTSIINNDLAIVKRYGRTLRENHLVEVLANVPEEVDIRTVSSNHKWTISWPSLSMVSSPYGPALSLPRQACSILTTLRAVHGSHAAETTKLGSFDFANNQRLTTNGPTTKRPRSRERGL